MPRYRTRPPSEWQEARQERIDDFHRFNDNEAVMERQHYAGIDAETERKARLAKNAALIAQLEKE